MNSKLKAVFYYTASIMCLAGIPAIAEIFFGMPHITFYQFVVVMVAVIACGTMRDIASSWWNQKTIVWTPGNGENTEDLLKKCQDYTERIKAKRKSMMIIILMAMSFSVSAQSTSLVGLEEQGMMAPDSIKGMKIDSLVFYGDSTVLKIYPKQDSIVITDSYGHVTMLMSANLLVTAQSPQTRQMYQCISFGSETLIEYSYSARTKLWGFVISTEGRTYTEGSKLWRPFPPLRLKKPVRQRVKPTMSHG